MSPRAPVKREKPMAKKQIDRNTIGRISAQPRLHQRAGAIQSSGTVNHALPLELEEPPVQLSRLVDAHQVIVRQVRTLAKRASVLGDDGTNDLVVSEVLRTNELQLWFLSEHLVDVPLVRAQEPSSDAGAVQ